MTQWEYCEVDFDGSTTFIYFYDEAGEYIDRPIKHPRLGIMLAKLGHDGWEIISSWWRSDRKVTYMLKRPRETEWTAADREHAKQTYLKNHPKEAKLQKRFNVERSSLKQKSMLPVFRYLIKNEDGKEIGEYTTSDFPPFKGSVIKLKDIPDYDYAEGLGVVWMSARDSNTVILKVKPSNRARLT